MLPKQNIVYDNNRVILEKEGEEIVQKHAR